MNLAPLPVTVPLGVAALIAGTGNFLPRRALDSIAFATAAAVLGICAALAVQSSHGTIVYWFGGWRPAPPAHFPVGVCFTIDPIGAGLAALVALLVLGAFTFSWSYFESVKSLYHALMLAFLGAMCGMCLTGDLFNMFVWFELMTATAVALCGYKSEESQPLQGALNFAVVNTVGAFLTLTGVALLYAMTGALNMSEIGLTLHKHTPVPSFLCVAFLFVVAGFLVKAAVVPFHFWLADAHAVAPTPVCILFSGVMVELGLYAVARIYWVVFAPAFGADARAVRLLLITIGSITVVVGAIYCFSQRHLKRLLAFSTISHVGIMTTGFGLLQAGALGGVAIYLVGHALVKASLFIVAGCLLHRFQSVDEFDLRGRGRKMPLLGLMMATAALGLAGVPPFATFYGQALVDRQAEDLHLSWLPWVMSLGEMLTAAAVLRVVGRVFLGVGAKREATSGGAPHIPMKAETVGHHSRLPAFMWAPAVLFLLMALVIAVAGPARGVVERFAAGFQQSRAYQLPILDGSPLAPASMRPFTPVRLSWRQLATPAGAIVLALATLFPGALGAFGRGYEQAVRVVLRPFRLLQSGRVGDYIAWFALGISAYGAALLAFCR